jgi:uncharacterized membrane protein
MPLVAVILLAIVAAIPITLIFLAVRQSDLSKRLAELEERLRAAERALSGADGKGENRREATVHQTEGSRSLVEDLARARAEQALPPPPPPFAWTPTAASTPRAFLPSPIVPARLRESPAKIPGRGEIEEKRGQKRAGVVDWEKFLGVKLFAWVGGLALFLGIAFFIKYSFEHNLIPPAVRVALGCATGIAARDGRFADAAQSLRRHFADALRDRNFDALRFQFRGTRNLSPPFRRAGFSGHVRHHRRGVHSRGSP